MENKEEKAALDDDLLDTVSGGVAYSDLCFDDQACADAGYCPSCNPWREGYSWDYFYRCSFGYKCGRCEYVVLLEL